MNRPRVSCRDFKVTVEAGAARAVSVVLILLQGGRAKEEGEPVWLAAFLGAVGVRRVDEVATGRSIEGLNRINFTIKKSLQFVI